MRFGKRQSGQLRSNRPGLVMAPARVTETHISTLFFVGERVYKMRSRFNSGPTSDVGSTAGRTASVRSRSIGG